MSYFAAINYIGDNGFMNENYFSPDYSSQMSWDKLSARANLDINATKLTLVKLNLLGELSQHNRPATEYSTLFPMIYDVPAAAFPVKTSTGVWGGDNVRKILLQNRWLKVFPLEMTGLYMPTCGLSRTCRFLLPV